MPDWMNKEQKKEWDKAEIIAARQGHGDNPSYIMGIFKKMTGYKSKNKKEGIEDYKSIFTND